MFRRSRAEDLVVSLLQEIHSGTLEEVVTRLPELSWNEVFHTVDSLSRRGGIILRRRGFAYDVSLPVMTRNTA
ncbi:MAG TPA: hypothetical protein VHQ67_03025 [Nitrospiraceae bacterium]|jgi:hypothetical protein|nr:hypothetical protein [Nitrospiraceae bacterium]